MPRLVIFLIIIGISVGLWSSFKNSGKAAKVKGAQTQIYKSALPELKPQPSKSHNFLPAKIDARNVAIIDVDSGYLLHEKDGLKPVPIASLTKIMTANIVLEENDLDDIVEISKEATLINGSTILLRPQEKITVENLLKALLIQSGNDAAMALAEKNAGSVEQFVKKMNKKALSIGMRDTVLKDPSGLNDEGVSSPKDIAILMAYSLRKDAFKKIVNIPQTEIFSIDGSIAHKLDNSNRLVKEEMFFPGIIGGKTGFTPLAGHNLVAAAQKDGHTIVSVVINTFSNANEASALETRKALDWAFTNHVWLDK